MRSIVAGLVLLLAAVSHGGGGSARQYRNAGLKVLSFEPPPGWEMAPQASYPHLLASYTQREGGKLTLAAQRVSPDVDAAALVAQSLAPLRLQGFSAVQTRPQGDQIRLEASIAKGRRFALQLYRVEQGIAYVVTMIGPLARAAALTREFDETVQAFQLTPSPDQASAR